MDPSRLAFAIGSLTERNHKTVTRPGHLGRYPTKTEVDFLDQSTPWAHVVERYLDAIHNDRIDSLERKLTGRQAAVLRDCGTELISQRYQNKQNRSIANTNAFVPQGRWEILERSESEVVVHVPVDGKLTTNARQAPFISTRISLQRINGNWKIAEIYRPCITCNSRTQHSGISLGFCRICKGSGVLSDVDMQCKFCDGSGKCKRCSMTPVPGWKRMDF